MIYFILNRNQVTEHMYETCEPWIFTARGNATGEYVAMKFLEENAPDIEGGMTAEECKTVMMAACECWVCDESDFI